MQQLCNYSEIKTPVNKFNPDTSAEDIKSMSQPIEYTVGLYSFFSEL